MHRLASFRLPGLIFVTLLTVAFATGAAVRAAPSVSEVQLALYQLQGGLLADLCDEPSSDPASGPLLALPSRCRQHRSRHGPSARRNRA